MTIRWHSVQMQRSESLFLWHCVGVPLLPIELTPFIPQMLQLVEFRLALVEENTIFANTCETLNLLQ